MFTCLCLIYTPRCREILVARVLASQPGDQGPTVFFKIGVFSISLNCDIAKYSTLEVNDAGVSDITLKTKVPCRERP